MSTIPIAEPQSSQPIAVGKIVDAYGIKGWLKIQAFSPVDRSQLLQVNNWVLAPAPGRALPWPSLTILQSKTHGQYIVAQASQLNDRDSVLALRGAEILLRREQFAALNDDEFYWVDLIGCRVINREKSELGIVSAVDDHGAHAILCVGDGSSAHLIPFVEMYVDQVSLDSRSIHVDWKSEWTANDDADAQGDRSKDDKS